MTITTPLTRDRAIRVMVVDDSAVVRGFIVRMLESDTRLQVVATCSNGQIAVQQAARLALDVIVLDIEMPVMDGLTALPHLIAANPDARIIMASTLTQRNAAISMEALARGATDTIAKPISSKLGSNDEFRRALVEKVVGLVRKRVGNPLDSTPVAAPVKVQVAKPALRRAGTARPRIIAIGSSTGGPQALTKMLAQLPRTVTCPIVIAQHMPATFTAVLAQHIARASGRPCSEAMHGTPICAGSIYVAPGDFHFEVVSECGIAMARLSQTAPQNFCRPSVDPLFASVARVYGADACGVMLTGMGSDGCDGARALAAAGAPVVAQDEATSVVWGMPGTVATAGLCSAVLPLNEIAGHLARLFEGGGR